MSLLAGPKLLLFLDSKAQNIFLFLPYSHLLLAPTTPSTQVVKVWSAAGEQVGVVRAHTSFLSQRIGPVTCMAFAPYDLLLASGGACRGVLRCAVLCCADFVA